MFGTDLNVVAFLEGAVTHPVGDGSVGQVESWIANPREAGSHVTQTVLQTSSILSCHGKHFHEASLPLLNGNLLGTCCINCNLLDKIILRVMNIILYLYQGLQIKLLWKDHLYHVLLVGHPRTKQKGRRDFAVIHLLVFLQYTGMQTNTVCVT